jgi:hypothetical protein
MAQLKYSAICTYCNQLVTVCWLHCVTVTCRRPIAKGPARQITESASASGGRAGRQVPARRQDLSYGAGSPRGETGLFPARDKRLGRLAPPRQKGSRHSHAELRPGRDPNAGPTAQEFSSWSALTSMRPGQRPFRAPLSDRRGPQFSLGGAGSAGDQPGQAATDMPPSGSRPRNGAATARANIDI